MIPKDNPKLSAQSHKRAKRQWDKFVVGHATAHVDAAVKWEEDALKNIPEDSPKRAVYLDALGLHLTGRFKKLKNILDLNQAISATREAIDLTPQTHNSWPIYKNNLANRLRYRYQRKRILSDLDEAICIGLLVVEVIDPGHSNRPVYLKELAYRHRARYRHQQQVEDLDIAIQYLTQAIAITKEGDLEWVEYIRNLVSLTEERFWVTGAREGIDGAIHATKSVLAAVLEKTPRWAELVDNLGWSLDDIFDTPYGVDYMGESVRRGNAAVRNGHSAPSIRMRSRRPLSPTPTAINFWRRVYEAAKAALSLGVKLVSRSLFNTNKHGMLRHLTGLAANGAAVALLLGRDAKDALDLIEQGRSILAATLEGERAELVDIQESLPEFSRRFNSLRQELHTALLRVEKSQSLEKTRPLLDINNEMDQVLDEIRSQPGFGDFFLPPSRESLLESAASGPLVVLNASYHGCDAILVEKEQIRHVTLSELDYQDLIDIAATSDLSSPETLNWLWAKVAQPVLDALNFTKPGDKNQCPRIWWIPTGAFSKMPLHAAGNHSEDLPDTVMDRVMSSYSTSINAVIHGRKRANTKTPIGKALLVPMETTPGIAGPPGPPGRPPSPFRLPLAEKEVQEVRKLCSQLSLRPTRLSGSGSLPTATTMTSTPITTRSSMTKSKAEAHLPGCRIFHFVGHHFPCGRDPANSYLLLPDWQSDPLTVGSVLDMMLNHRRHRKRKRHQSVPQPLPPLPPPFLAYLSTKSTHGKSNAPPSSSSSVRDDDFHLVSAYQLAGFRHVVGTLWDVPREDGSCVVAARVFYEGLRDGGMTDEAVCRGLHNATLELRRRWLCARNTKAEQGSGKSIGESSREGGFPRDIGGEDDYNEEDKARSMPWVAYVHFGV